MKNLIYILSLGLFLGLCVAPAQSLAKDCVLIKKINVERGKVCISNNSLTLETKNGPSPGVVFPASINYKQQTITVSGNIQDFMDLASSEISFNPTKSFLVVGLRLSKNYLGEVKITQDDGFLVANGVYFSYYKD